MQKGDYAAAKTALLKVYGKYSLVPNFSDNFDGDVKLEAHSLQLDMNSMQNLFLKLLLLIKEMITLTGDIPVKVLHSRASIMRSQEYGIVWGNVIPSDQILDEFEPNDPRYKYTFYESGDKILTMGVLQPGTALTEDGMNVAQSTTQWRN